MINKIKSFFRSRKTAPTTSELLMAESQLHTVWLMLCGMSVENENLTVTGIIDCV